MDGRNIVSSEVCEEKTREDTGKDMWIILPCGLCVLWQPHSARHTQLLSALRETNPRLNPFEFEFIKGVVGVCGYLSEPYLGLSDTYSDTRCPR